MLASHSYSDEDFPDFLKDVLCGEHLEGPAAGILAKVVEEGIGNLADKQLIVFEKYVINEFVNEEC